MSIALIPLLGALPAVAAAAAGLLAWGAMHPAAQIFGPTIRRAGGHKALALTFDDGPNPAITPKLLNLLEGHGVRATFFLIGRFVRACPGLVREAAARGHVVANHTDTHPNLFWLWSGQVSEELARCQDAITQVAGVGKARWMRPPYGIRGPHLDAVVRRQGLEGVVMWSVIAYDWKPQPAARLIARLGRVRGGDLVVLHDGDHRGLGGDRGHVLAALEYWLPRWRDAGLDFVTMDEVSSGAGEGRNPAARGSG